MNINYYKYESVLEFIPKDNNIINKNIINEDISLYILNFINNYLKNVSNIIISLSGGVDSMVLTYILNNFKNINIICCHINYNNRNETNLERDFLIDWCKSLNIILETFNINNIKRDDIKRSDYEEMTKNIRFNFYNDLAKKYNTNYIFLAHHKDDLGENIFNNIMRGRRDILDLTVLKEINNINDMNIVRPMLKFKKKIIYKISEKYQIPYFLDTTPDWSCRGKMRRKIFPECELCYGKNYIDNILNLGNESDQICNIINKYILDELINNSNNYKYGFTIKTNKYMCENIIIKLLLKKLIFKFNIKMKIKDDIIENIKNIIINNQKASLKINIKYNMIYENYYLYFINEDVIEKKNYKQILLFNNKYSLENLLNGELLYIWKKNKYMPYYNFSIINKFLGNILEIDYISNIIILI